VNKPEDRTRDEAFPNISTKDVEMAYDTIAPEYSGAFNERRFLYEDRIVARMVADLLKSATSPIVLDIGCGTGHGASLIPGAAQYNGIDLSSRMIEIAQERLPDAKFVHGNAESLPYEDESFDAIVSFYGSLSHVANLEVAVREASRVLRPGGLIFAMLYSLRASGTKFGPGCDSLIANYHVRGLAEGAEIAIPARFLSPAGVKVIFDQRFELRHVRGLTVFYSHVDPPLNGVVAALSEGLDQIISGLVPGRAHTLCVTARKGNDGGAST
jgi:ubiquinone/menaquinone biosynthesis C-methylase UbiE